MSETERSGKPTTDHEEILRWAEQHGGTPACVIGVGKDGDVGLIRIDFPGYSGEESLAPISWEDWFAKFEERKLALVYREQDQFNKLVSRDSTGDEGRKTA